MSKIAWCSIVTCVVAVVAPHQAFAENKRICVEVVLERTSAHPPDPNKAKPVTEAQDSGDVAKPRSEKASPSVAPSVVVAGSEGDVMPPLAAASASSKPNLPLGQRPLAYLKRLLEYFISHESGFVAVKNDCQETMHIELYPLLDGWTAFARYTGTGREERVDRIGPNELTQYAERAATALLYGKPISATINRETVLAADSKQYAQRIGGTHHFMMGVGTQLRFGKFATAIDNAADPNNGTAVDQFRFMSPVAFFMGYRGRFESWGLETNVFAAIGTTTKTASKNPAGGHVDFAGDGALQLHFLHYFDPRGLVSFYAGAGATFELLGFSAIRAASRRSTGTRSALLDGGLDADLVFGWEFMRASTAQFFLQMDLQAPAYVLASQSEDGSVHGWYPSTTLKLGVMF